MKRKTSPAKTRVTRENLTSQVREVLDNEQKTHDNPFAEMLSHYNHTLYPNDLVPPFFKTVRDIIPHLKKARESRVLHKLLEGYIAELASRLSNPFFTVKEIYAVPGARNDALSVNPHREILWEVFGTESRVEEDLRKLERDGKQNRLKVAVVLDPEIDHRLFERFTRARQGSDILWIRISDLMLVRRFSETVQMFERKLAYLPPGWPDQLELKCFKLAPGHKHWTNVPDVPFCYFGLKDHESSATLEDPAFLVDILNTGSQEARIDAAYINVRFRQTKLHGFPGDEILRPACTIELPLNDGMEGYRRVDLDDPVLVQPGKYRRLRLLLRDAGYAWRGEVEMGLIYGNRKILPCPTLSLLL